MSAERIFSVAVGLILIAGIGMAATTLQSSVETSPDDVIDLDAASLPMGSDELGEYDERLNSDSGSATKPADRQDAEETGSGSGGDGDERESTGENGDGDAGGSDGNDGDAGGSDDAGDAGGSDGDDGDEAGSDGNDGDAGGSDGDDGMTSGGQDGGELPGGDEQSLLEWLLSLLRALLAFLLRVLPALVLLGLLAVVVANRDRIAAFLSRIGPGSDGSGSADRGAAFRAAPSNEVTRAWYEMARLLDVDSIETTSPRECANRAVDAGADRSAVERVTATFEDVRYGHADVTPERRARARDGLDDVRAQLGGSR